MPKYRPGSDLKVEKGRPNQRSPFFTPCSASFNLEIESQSPLDLSFTENRIARGSVRTERGNRHQTRSDNVESRVVNRCNVGSIENVEAFNQKLEVRTLSKPKPPREASIKIHESWLLEAVTSEWQEVTVAT